MAKHASLLDIHNEIIKLKKERKDFILSKLKGRKQTYIAEEAGISPQRFNNWVNISSELNEEEITKVNNALNS